MATDIWKESILNWKLKISSAAYIADITHRKLGTYGAQYYTLYNHPETKCTRTGGILTRKGTRDQITNLRILMQKAREHQQPLYFVDFTIRYSRLTYTQKLTG